MKQVLDILKYTAINPKYFNEFLNFKSYIANNMTDELAKRIKDTISDKSAVHSEVKKITGKLLNNRNIINLNTTNEKNNTIQLIIDNIKIIPDNDGVNLCVNPIILDNQNYNVCIKSNRIGVTELSNISGSFTVKVASQTLAYCEEKYSVGFSNNDFSKGFAISAGDGETGIKSDVILKVIYFDDTNYIIDNADKYTDISALIKNIKG